MSKQADLTTCLQELDRIHIELANIARWREWIESVRELRELDETERYWHKQEARWQRLAVSFEPTR